MLRPTRLLWFAPRHSRERAHLGSLPWRSHLATQRSPLPQGRGLPWPVRRSQDWRADQVQNGVLVACRDQLAKQAILLACISPHSLRLGRVVPVLPVGPAGALQPLRRARSGARSTMHAASPVPHRRPVTGAAVNSPCTPTALHGVNVGRLRADGTSRRRHVGRQDRTARKHAERRDRVSLGGRAIRAPRPLIAELGRRKSR